MKPSEQIRKREEELRLAFRAEHPYFFADNGYWPDFRYQAVLDWLDDKNAAILHVT